MTELQFEKFKNQLDYVLKNSPFYQKMFAGIEAADIKTPEDIRKLPLSNKGDLREVYPLGLQAVPDEEVVRIHSSSGTTGQPIIIPYTANDVDVWGEMFKRCYEVAGITRQDRIQITPGYGLWTAGIGFQNGCEKLGAMAIPMGPGNTEKQLKMMVDLKSTVLASTSSYALLLAEQVQARGMKDQICLRKGIIGSERWGDKMRARIMNELGIEIYDIYGLTEVYGPGISIDCSLHNGLHYWDDYLYFEIIDPQTLEPVPDGKYGELVITTLCKEGAPLIRYRTHDMTRLLPGQCPCGLPYPRHDRIIGRTDDMIKVKGVNIYPGQIDELLRDVEGVSSEYQVFVDHVNGRDEMLLNFEMEPGVVAESLEQQVIHFFKSRIGIKISARGHAIGELPRSEKKSVRIIDRRFE
ncbi:MULTISPECIES: phenylacetate--CoA ligase [unclassified Clostridium]|uniref:phenylacetate--CoA ligase family protein n=1 Tax=unclassified Clostridium TaxID=2614128 RepID=UPI00110596A0|nr:MULTISPECIES: phenylacetate--CoA ligase [unclassified Clostridium]